LLRHGSLTHSRHGISVTVSVSGALIRDRDTTVGISITLVTGLAVIVSVTATFMVSLTNGFWINTIHVAVVTSWAASESIAVSTEEAVVIGIIANLVKSHTFCVLHTLGLASVGISVAEILNVTVSVIIAAAGVRALVTDRGGVNTVQLVIVTSLTASII